MEIDRSEDKTALFDATAATRLEYVIQGSKCADHVLKYSQLNEDCPLNINPEEFRRHEDCSILIEKRQKLSEALANLDAFTALD